MNRGLGRQPVFRAETDHQDFVALLEDIAQRWAAAIYAYCCMSTHYHLLLQTPLGNLSRIMRHIELPLAMVLVSLGLAGVLR